jgi:WD40 repeat protein
MLASANTDGAVNLWNISERLVRYPMRLTGHAGPVEDVAFSPIADVLASASDDGTVKLWDAGTGNAIETIRPRAGRVHAVAFSRNGRLLLGGSNGALLLYDVPKVDRLAGNAIEAH